MAEKTERFQVEEVHLKSRGRCRKVTPLAQTSKPKHWK